MALKIADTDLINDAALQGYWQMEDLNDSGPHNYDLLQSGDPVLEDSKFLKGYKFVAGSSQYLRTPASSPALNIVGDQTWMYWCRPDVASGRAGAMSVFESGVGEKKLWIEADHNLYARLNGLSTETLDCGPVTPDVLSHFAMVYDKINGTFRVYVNANVVANENVTGDIVTFSNTQVTFAQDNNGSYHSCNMDDAAIFSRVVTVEEIDNLVNGSAEPAPEAATPIFAGFWR